jgi:hypothetical protein
MKQNLNFLIRGASMTQPFFSLLNTPYATDGGQFNQGATTFEEFSFLLHSAWNNGTFVDQSSFQLDALWPFTANYDLVNYFVDTSRTNSAYGSTNFIYQPNFANSIPALAVLTHADPYWILQSGFGDYLSSGYEGNPPSTWALSVNGDDTSAA